jgi:hypothetical protein
MAPGSAAHRFALRSIRGTQTNKRPGVIPAFLRHCERSEDSSLLRQRRKLDCFAAEPVIGRAFARPVGSSQ